MRESETVLAQPENWIPVGTVVGGLGEWRVYMARRAANEAWDGAVQYHRVCVSLAVKGKKARTLLLTAWDGTRATRTSARTRLQGEDPAMVEGAVALLKPYTPTVLREFHLEELVRFGRPPSLLPLPPSTCAEPST